MKKFYLGLGVYLLSALLFAQSHTVSIETSEESTKKGGMFTTFDVQVFDQDDENIYGLVKKPGFGTVTYLLNTYDKQSYNLLSETEYFNKGFMGLKNPKVWEFSVHELSGKPFGTFLLINTKEKKQTLYGQYLKGGKFDGDPVELATIPYASGWGYFNNSAYVQTYKDAGSFSVETSSYDKKTKESTAKTYFYDDNISLLDERTIALPYEKEKIRSSYSEMDENGNLYFLVEILEKEITKQNKKEKLTPDDISYNFVVYKRGDDSPMEFSFKLDYFVTQCKFIIKDGVIYCAGFWGKKGEYEISGSFSCRYDAATGQEISTDIHEFDEEFIEEFYTEKEVKKAEKKGKDLEVPHVKFYDIFLNSDGSYYLVGEYAYQYQVCYTDSRGNTRCYWVYVHNDILTLKVNKDGLIEWTKKIPRRSSSSNKSLVMYAYKHVGNEVLYIYYDNKENFGVENPREVKYLNFAKEERVELIGAIIDMDGSVNKQSIYDVKTKEYELTIFPGLMKNFGDAFYTTGIEEAGKITTKRKVLVKLKID